MLTSGMGVGCSLKRLGAHRARRVTIQDSLPRFAVSDNVNAEWYRYRDFKAVRSRPSEGLRARETAVVEVLHEGRGRVRAQLLR